MYQNIFLLEMSSYKHETVCCMVFAARTMVRTLLKTLARFICDGSNSKLQLLLAKEKGKDKN